MLEKIVVGDITAPDNPADIIIGMNASLDDVTGIGLPFVRGIELENLMDIGTVLSFPFDGSRMLHMIVCHYIGDGGWADADKHIRLGLDFLWRKSRIEGDEERSFSIVQIGSGEIGKRDGADSVAIRTAMATSYLPVTLFVRDPEVGGVPVLVRREPLQAVSVWRPMYGQESIAV